MTAEDFSLNRVAETDPDLAMRLARWMAYSVLEECWARTYSNSAGELENVPLATVFHDLMLANGESDEWDFGHEENQPSTKLLVAGEHQKIMILGGPGQGKSTLTQWSALCHWVRSLFAFECQTEEQFTQKLGLSTDDARALALRSKEIFERATNEQHGPTTALAIRIDLPHFAKFFSQRTTDSSTIIYEYCAAQSETLGAHVTTNEWARLSKIFNNFWMFDALDEIASTKLCLQFIYFIYDISPKLSNASTILVTSRPQGFIGEWDRGTRVTFNFDTVKVEPRSNFSRPFLPLQPFWHFGSPRIQVRLRVTFEAWTVTTLTPSDAREIARRLTATRYSHQPKIGEQIRNLVARALEDLNTAALLRTPLYVSIILAVADAMGVVPSDRAVLLQRFYSLLLAREAKKSEGSERHKFFADHAWAVAMLHAKVALRLHVRGEIDGATTGVDEGTLKQLATETIQSRIKNPTTVVELAQQLCDCAKERLVLLVEREVGYLRFDVRLIQEFFAAKALFDTAHDEELRQSPELAGERLLAVIAHSWWQQVVLMAVSTWVDAYETRLLELVLDWCAKNSGHNQSLLAAGGAGEQLTAAILADRAIFRLPHFAARLLEVAIRSRWTSTNSISPAQIASAAIQLKSVDEVPYQHFLEQLRVRWNDGRRYDVVEFLVRSRSITDRQCHAVLEELCRSLNNPWEIFQDVREGNFSGALYPEWLEKLLVERIADFNPFAHVQFLFGAAILLKDPILAPLVAIATSHRVLAKIFNAESKSVGVDFVPLDSHREEWTTLSKLIPRSNSNWLAFGGICDFHAAPSLATLATAVDAYGQLPIQTPVPAYFAWPLAGAIAAARVNFASSQTWERSNDTSSDGGNVASEWEQFEDDVRLNNEDRTRSNKWHLLWSFGCEWNDYRALKDGDLNLVDWEQQLKLGVPFALTIANFSEFEPGIHGTIGERAGVLSSKVLVQMARTVLGASWLALYLPEAPSNTSIEAQALAEVTPPLPTNLVWTPARLHLSKWIIEATQKHHLPRLLLWLLVLLPSTRDMWLEIGGDAIPEPESESAKAPWAAPQFLLHINDAKKRSRLLALIQSDAETKSEILHYLADLLSQPTTASEVEALLDLLKATPISQHNTRAIIHLTLAHWTAKQPSPLSKAAGQVRLKISVQPMAPTIPAHRAAPSDAVLTIDSLKLKSLRSINNLTITPTAPTADDHGQWLVILGDNGVGKTTLLRGISLALVTPQYVPRGPEIDAQQLVRNGLVTNGTEAGSAEITTKQASKTTTFEIKFSRTTERVEEWKPDEKNDRPFVVGYGVYRGSAHGGEADGSEINEPHAIKSLIDPRHTLFSARSWLRNLVDPNDIIKPSVLNAVKEVLRPAGVTSVVFSGEQGFIFDGPAVGEQIPISGMSDGFLAVIGWMIDLLARWVKFAERKQWEIPLDFHKQMTGVALIDEIDQHIHPIWQRELIQSVRSVFPRMTFIATTHNPLTVIELNEGELFRMFRDEKNEVVVRQEKSVKGRSTDNILTGHWFDLVSTLDDETLGWMEEHRKMMRDNVDRSDPDRQALEAKIRARTGTYADLSIERLALGVAQEIMDEEHVQRSRELRMTTEERVAFRAKLLSRVREKLQAPESK